MTTATKSRKNKKRPLHQTGRLIKQLRKASGYTQEEIKTILGFQATSAISKIESRDFIPDLMRLQKLLSLLNPAAEQKRQILEYYGYQESDLPDKHEFITGLRQKAQKGDILSALHTLFYLFVYDKDYTGLIETAQSLYHQSFYIPQSVRVCTREVEMILREILSCRRLLAQGMLSKQSLAFEEALQRAEMAQQLLTLVHDRFDRKLNPDAKLFLTLLRLHISFCYENTHFGMLRLKNGLQTETLEARLEDRKLPRIQSVILDIERQFPDYNLQEIRQMTLFVERETLNLLASQNDLSDQAQLSKLLSDLQIRVQDTPVASDWNKALAKQPEKVFSQVFQSYFKSSRSEQKVWEPTLERYRQILKAHQQVSNWDGNTAQAAIVTTFLNYPVLLARLGHFSWAQDILNLLYLQLTVADTHYRWTNSQALCKGLEYIHLTQLSLKKLSESKLPEADSCLSEMAGLIERIVRDLRNVKSLNSPRFLRYTFIEEPVFYFVFLHASRHEQLKHHPALVQLMPQFEAQLKGE